MSQRKSKIPEKKWKWIHELSEFVGHRKAVLRGNFMLCKHSSENDKVPI